MATTRPRTDWDRWNALAAGKFPSELLGRFALRNAPTEGVDPRPIAVDIGCGAGANASMLDDVGFSVIAIDASAVGIQRLKSRRSCANIDARVGDAAQTGLDDQSCDFICAIGLLEAVDRMTAKAIVVEADRVLHSTGIGMFLFAAEDDFRIGASGEFQIEGYNESDALNLFSSLSRSVTLDKSIITFEGGRRSQIDWIVRVGKYK